MEKEKIRAVWIREDLYEQIPTMLKLNPLRFSNIRQFVNVAVSNQIRHELNAKKKYDETTKKIAQYAKKE